MKSPSMNEPITLTIRTLSGIALKSNGDSVILYLKEAPSTEPIPRKINSSPFHLLSNYY